jgi:hypothetical protein
LGAVLLGITLVVSALLLRLQEPVSAGEKR